MKLRNALILALTAFIWGTSFVAQSVGMDYIGPFTFNGVRSFIGAITLIPFILIQKKFQRKTKRTAKEAPENKALIDKKNIKELIAGGILCGVLLFVSSSLQQIGIKYTSAGKAGFITAFYIVLVPVIGIFMKKTSGWKIWAAVVLALAGLYCLCIKEGLSIGKGDILIFFCAIGFSLHIMVIDYFAPKVNGVALSCIQFLVCGFASVPFMLGLEQPGMTAIISAWLPILYAGVLSCGVAYTLQIVGQKNMNPTVASLILSLESVTSVIAGFLVLHQNLSQRELIGCVLMFIAIILAQLPEKF